MVLAEVVEEVELPVVRHGLGGRGARPGHGRRRPTHGGELTNPAGVVRPAVEAALEVARRGLSDDPPVAPPAGLRRYLGFTRLPTTVLQAIARVVEGDDEFRARVAREVGEADVGRAGWLWLNRPDGYLDELRKLEDEAEAVAAAEADDREERDARRRLAAAQSAADRATATSRAQAEEIDELRAELLGERSRLADVAARLAEVDDELDRVRVERVRAVRQLKEVEARLAERTVELKQLKAQFRDAETERARRLEPPGSGHRRRERHGWVGRWAGGAARRVGRRVGRPRRAHPASRAAGGHRGRSAIARSAGSGCSEPAPPGRRAADRSSRSDPGSAVGGSGCGRSGRRAG